MPAPTAPVDVTVTLNQTQVDYLWDILETEFPNVTPAQAMDTLEKWAFEGMQTNLVEVLRKRQRSAQQVATTTLQTDFVNA